MKLEEGYSGEIEYIGGISLNLIYWDCSCEIHYIHNVSEEICSRCNSNKEDHPSSRENEVIEYLPT